MRYLSALLPLLLAGPLAAQPKKPQPDPADPRTVLRNFLLAETQKHFDARRAEVARLKTPEEIRSRQQLLKKMFLDAIGGLPDKTPLNPKVVGTLKGPGYTAEKVIFESRPNHHVTAVFYRPEGKGPFPGVLVPCGHSTNGKAADAYQRGSILMAQNGLAVLCYDPIGQGERLQLLDAMGKPAIKGSTSEHTMCGIGALLVGKSTATYRIWDGIRAMDYLASRPEVDPKRLGCTGNSGGGTMTAYLMALDERIVCAAPSCYITSLERLFATIGPQDAEQNIPGQVAFGMEHADYVTMRAPLPTLIAAASQDFFDIQGVWSTFREAKLLYGKLGYAERVSVFEFDDKHGWSKPRREACMRWMRRWLLGKDDAPVEGDFPIWKDADLQCTRSGQVLTDFKGLSVFHLNAQELKATASRRKAFLDPSVVEKPATLIRNVLRLPTMVAPGKRLDDGTTIETEPGLRLPIRITRNPQAKTKTRLLILTDTTEEPKVPAGDYAQVVRFSPRGLGGPAGKGYFGGDFKEAFLAIHLDRPLLGQRTLDVLSVLGDQDDGEDWHVAARGPTSCLAAMHAAVLHRRVRSLLLEKPLVSWSAVVETPISTDQLTNAVPGVLRRYDLPELAALLAPVPVTLRGTVEAQGKTVPLSEVRRAYNVAAERYLRMKVDGFRIEPLP